MQQKKETDFTILLIGIIFLIAALCSCTSTHLHKSGYYRVRAIDNQNCYYLDGVKGKYKMPDNKSKVGDKIKLQRVADSTKENVIRLIY